MRVVFILILLDMLSYIYLTLALTLDRMREPRLLALVVVITNFVTYAENSFAIFLCARDHSGSGDDLYYNEVDSMLF